MKEDFKKVFTNIPLGERTNPIYVDQKYGPMSWNVVWLEVEHDTPMSIEILTALKRMQII